MNAPAFNAALESSTCMRLSAIQCAALHESDFSYMFAEENSTDDSADSCVDHKTCELIATSLITESRQAQRDYSELIRKITWIQIIKTL